LGDLSSLVNASNLTRIEIAAKETIALRQVSNLVDLKKKSPFNLTTRAFGFKEHFCTAQKSGRKKMREQVSSVLKAWKIWYSRRTDYNCNSWSVIIYNQPVHNGMSPESCTPVTC